MKKRIDTKTLTLYAIFGLLSYILCVAMFGIELTALPYLYHQIPAYMPKTINQNFNPVIKNTLYFFIIRCFVLNGPGILYLAGSLGELWGVGVAVFGIFLQAWITTWYLFTRKPRGSEEKAYE